MAINFLMKSYASGLVKVTIDKDGVEHIIKRGSPVTFAEAEAMSNTFHGLNGAEITDKQDLIIDKMQELL